MGRNCEPFTRKIINEGTMLATATALVSVCEPRGCASNDSASRFASMLNLRSMLSNGYCAGLSLQASRLCMRLQQLALLAHVDLESQTWPLKLQVYASRKISFSFFLGVPSTTLVSRLHPVCSGSLSEPDACRRRRHTPPLASSPEANHKHLKTGFLSR